MLYLDCAAAAPADPAVLEFYNSSLQEDFANQESLHYLAYRTREKIAAAERELSAALTGSPEYKVIWGNSATELFQLLSCFLQGRKIVSSVLEHPALKTNLKAQCAVSEIKCDPSGRLIAEEPPFTPDAVCFHHVQSELGVIQELDTLFSCYPDSLHITDAVQAAGKMELSAAADITIISGVKFGAPGGAAILVNPRSQASEKLPDFAARFRSECYRISRPGAAMVRTLAFAAAHAQKIRKENHAKAEKANALFRKLTGRFNIHPSLPADVPASPHILSMRLPGVQSAVIVRALSEKNIYVSSGSACAAESAMPSPALLALGWKKTEAYSALRISFNIAPAEPEIKKFACALESALKNY